MSNYISGTRSSLKRGLKLVSSISRFAIAPIMLSRDYIKIPAIDVDQGTSIIWLRMVGIASLIFTIPITVLTLTAAIVSTLVITLITAFYALIQGIITAANPRTQDNKDTILAVVTAAGAPVRLDKHGEKHYRSLNPISPQKQPYSSEGAVIIDMSNVPIAPKSRV